MFLVRIIFVVLFLTPVVLDSLTQAAENKSPDTCTRNLAETGFNESEAGVILLANRLPASVALDDRGQIILKDSPGGLVSAISHIERSLTWIGFSGLPIESLPNQDSAAVDQLMGAQTDHIEKRPVHLSRAEVDGYYNGFSNRVLWPAFHGQIDKVKSHREDWEHYKAVNEKFARAAVDRLIELNNQGVRRNQIIWVHDYQLLLVPQMIRELLERIDLDFSVKIGFFLHIPFPNLESFRVIPDYAQQTILEGLLGADLIGLHAPFYERRLRDVATTVIGMQRASRYSIYGDQRVRVGSFPIGIEPARFHDAIKKPEVQELTRQILKDLDGAKLLLGVDRRDYSKGLVEKLLAYEKYLEKHPEAHGNIQLFQVAVPTRDKILEYQEYRDELEKIAARINHRFSIDGRPSPVVIFTGSLNADQLTAYFRASDMLLVTSIADGMNLVAFEYAVSQADKVTDGSVIILSETTGAASLLDGSLRVDPTDPDAIAEAIEKAFNMSGSQRSLRANLNIQVVTENPVGFWASNFLTNLEQSDSKISPPSIEPHLPRMLAQYGRSQRRLIMLDFDGTLVGFKNDPEAVQLSSEAHARVSALVSDPKNVVYINSGRSREYLEKQFPEADFPGLGLVADHGYYFRKAGTGEWLESIPNLNARLGDVRRVLSNKVDPVMKSYLLELPGSFIERKETSLAFHYRASEGSLLPSQIRRIVQRLKDDLSIAAGPSSGLLSILHGELVVEVQPRGITKGEFIERHIRTSDYGFITYFGDGMTDESAFAALPSDSFRVFVYYPERRRVSLADFQVETSTGALDVLELLANSNERP